jgi:hypothetical protein
MWFERIYTFGLKRFATVVLTVYMWFESIYTFGLKRFATVV